jgi:chromosome partitioning protein
MFTVCVMNAKGGVAKTTSAMCLASYIAAKGSKVLFMDLDPQANATKTYLKIPVGQSAEEPNLHNALENFISSKGKSNIIRDVVKTVRGNLDILPAHPQMEELKDNFRKDRRAIEVISRMLAPLTEGYDYLVIDCPADISIYVENAIELSNACLLPTTFDIYGLDGLSLIIPTILEIKGDDFEDYRILYTKVNQSATRIGQEIKEHTEMLEKMGKVLDFKVPIDQRIQNGQARYEDPMTSPGYGTSMARQAYTKLGNYVMENWK